MAVDINNDLKKAADKTNVYKTYKQYKKDYEDLKKKAGNSQEQANKYVSNQLGDFVKWRKKHTANAKTFTDDLIKQLKEIFISEVRMKIKGQEPRLVKINAMKKLDATVSQVKYQEQHF